MGRLFMLLGVMVSLVLIVSCRSVSTKAIAATPSLLGTEWALFESKATLAISTDGKVSGRGGCNRFFGDVTFTGGGMKLGALGSTQMGCAEEIMGAEDKYLKDLQLVERYKAEGTELLLSGKKLKAPMRFRKL